MTTDKEKIAAEIERRKMKAIVQKRLFLATEYEDIASFIEATYPKSLTPKR